MTEIQLLQHFLRKRYYLTLDKRLAYVEKNMATKTDLSRIYTTLDTIVGMLETHETKRLAVDTQLDHHQTTLDDHNRRIQGLEQV